MSTQTPNDSVSHWHATRGAAGLPTQDLPPGAEVVVVGGGLLGLCTAYWLARAGHAPLLIERGLPGAGASGRNGGFMVAGTAEAYPNAIARHGHAMARGVWQLTLDNRALLRQALAEEAIDCDYREPGHIVLALGEDQHARMARTVAALAADSFTAEMLDRRQLATQIATPLGATIVGGLYAPEDGLLHSARLLDGLARAAVRHGARICLDTELLAIEEDAGGVALMTSRGRVQAGRVLVATNAWLGRLLPALREVVRPVRGQTLSYAPSAPVFHAGLGAAVTPTGEYWQQTPDGTIVLGGCRALAPGGDVGLYTNAPTAEVQAAIERVLPDLFPALGGLRVERRWAGLMAFTADYMPIVDRAPGLEHTWLVGGFCGHGMPFGMVLGQALAAALTGAAPAELAWFRHDRASLQGA